MNDMIKLSEYISAVEGINHTSGIDPESVEITGGYVCDMLSDVMGSARAGQAWITIMKHLNTVAVASLTGIPAIIMAKGFTPDEPVVEKAENEGICLISSPLDTFSLAGILYRMLNS
jgi:predicted transcriptional regulator